MSIEPNPFDAEDKAWECANQEDPWVMYLIVRESLNMTAGKVGAQCGHAVGMVCMQYTEHMTDDIDTDFPAMRCLHFQAWAKESYRKVVLAADDKQWEKIKAELRCFVVRDAGLTQVEAGSETVIGLWPMKKSQRPKLLKRLQALP